LQFLSRPRRPRRSGEWTPAKAVTFVVTLAASRSVTFAAHQAGMSRKSAYALKARNSAFAEAWNAALKAGEASGSARGKGDRPDTSYNPRTAPAQRNDARAAAAAWNSLIDNELGPVREAESARRDSFFASLAGSVDSAPLAARRSGK
jgi:hypothetical protein